MVTGNKKFEILAKTFFGLEDVLAKELKGLKAERIEKRNRAVSFYGDNIMLYKANLWLRTATKILKPIRIFKARNEYRLYSELQKIDWSEYMSYRDSLYISSTVYSKFFTHSKYVVYKTKDAIVDQFKNKTGKRPEISGNNPSLQVNIHIQNDVCTVSLDSSGRQLNQRGYRIEQTEAPLNEVLAAGLVLLSGWRRDCTFIDPMCGSGTIPIEAAMYAYNMAPNLHRNSFSFMNWKDFDKSLWTKLLNEAEQKITPFPHRIYGYDIAPRAIRIAKKNMAEARLQGKITFEVQNFEDLNRLGDGKGLMIINPPYDERLESRNIDLFYEMIGNKLKQQFAGYQAWILSGNVEAIKHVGLKTASRMHLNNGGLKCKYHQFNIYKGSNEDELF